MKKNRNIVIGINWEQNSTAALMVDNQIVGCVSEERFTNIKNDERYPINAINWLIKEFKVNKEEISAVNYISHSWTPTYSLIRHYTKFSIDDYIDEQNKFNEEMNRNTSNSSISIDNSIIPEINLISRDNSLDNSIIPEILVTN